MSSEDMRTHLEFIQNAITRMASNSFQLKGWAVVLVSSLFALAARDSEQGFVLVAYLPVTVFWGLDGYYLWQERLFRDLYNSVAARPVSAFEMNTTSFNFGFRQYLGSVFSKTLIPFYGVLLLASLIATGLTS